MGTWLYRVMVLVMLSPIGVYYGMLALEKYETWEGERAALAEQVAEEKRTVDMRNGIDKHGRTHRPLVLFRNFA